MTIGFNGTRGTPRLDLGDAMQEHMFDRSTAFMGLKLFPPLAVPEKKADYPKIERDGMIRPTNVKRAPNASYSRGDIEGAKASYSCQERGHEQQLDHSLIQFYKSDFDAELVASRKAFWTCLYDQEVDIRDIVLNTTTFTTVNDHRTDVATAWSDPTAPIIGDILDAVEKVRARTGDDADTVAFGKALLRHMLKNAEIRDAIKYTARTTAAEIEHALKDLFGVSKLHVAGGIVNTANEGQAAVIADIWGSEWCVVAKTRDPGDDITEYGLGWTPVWTDDADTESVMIEEYEEAQTRSTVFRGRSHADEVLIDFDCEQLLDVAAA